MYVLQKRKEVKGNPSAERRLRPTLIARPSASLHQEGRCTAPFDGMNIVQRASTFADLLALDSAQTAIGQERIDFALVAIAQAAIDPFVVGSSRRELLLLLTLAAAAVRSAQSLTAHLTQLEAAVVAVAAAVPVQTTLLLPM